MAAVLVAACFIRRRGCYFCSRSSIPGLVGNLLREHSISLRKAQPREIRQDTVDRAVDFRQSIVGVAISLRGKPPTMRF